MAKSKLASLALKSYGDEEKPMPMMKGETRERMDEGGDMASEMEALGGALKRGDWKAAARAFKEAYRLC